MRACVFITPQKSNTAYGTDGSAHTSVYMASRVTVEAPCSRTFGSKSDTRELYTRAIGSPLRSLLSSDAAPVVVWETFRGYIPDITRTLVVAVRTQDHILVRDIFSLLLGFSGMRACGADESMRDIACWMVKACILGPFNDATFVIVDGFRLLAALRGMPSIRECLAVTMRNFPMKSEAILAGAIAFLECSPEMDTEEDVLVVWLCNVAWLRWESKQYATLFVSWVLGSLRAGCTTKRRYIIPVALHVAGKRRFEEAMQSMTFEISRFDAYKIDT